MFGKRSRSRRMMRSVSSTRQRGLGEEGHAVGIGQLERGPRPPRSRRGRSGPAPRPSCPRPPRGPRGRPGRSCSPRRRTSSPPRAPWSRAGRWRRSCCRLRACGVRVHARRDAVGGEDDRLALRHLGLLLDEDRAALAQLLDHVLVVHDLLAHVDGRPVQLERALDRLDGTVDARAVAARRGEQQLFGGARPSRQRLASERLAARSPRSRRGCAPRPRTGRRSGGASRGSRSRSGRSSGTPASQEREVVVEDRRPGARREMTRPRRPRVPPRAAAPQAGDPRSPRAGC